MFPSNDPPDTSVSVEESSPLYHPPIFDVFTDFQRYKNGGLEFIRHDTMSNQRAIIWAFMKKVGKSVFSGSLLRISMPVGLCEKRSFLQRIPDQWAYLPQYLDRARMSSNDPIERFKQVISFAMSGIHLTVQMEKPFNPILGETFQGIFSDGSEVCLEQISHHPPISAWLIEGPGDSFRLSGRGESKAKFSTNSMTVGMTGINELSFDDGTLIKWRFPVMRISGVIMGTRVVEHIGRWIFQDFTNDLICSIEFVDNSGMMNFFRSSSGKRSDEFEGFIARHRNVEFLQGDDEIKDLGEKICTVEGSWIDSISFGDVKYWDREKMDTPEVPRPPRTLLPSDSRLRTDCIAVARNDMKKAATEKNHLEEIQRHDRKLREKHSKGPRIPLKCSSSAHSEDCF